MFHIKNKERSILIFQFTMYAIDTAIKIPVFSEKIKAVRKAKKLSQKDFGRPLNIGQDAISDYETGKNEPNERTLNAIIMEYSINKAWFETGDGEMFSESAGEYRVGSMARPAKKTQIYLSQLPDKDAELYIPYYDVEITAGQIEQYFDDSDDRPEGYIYAPQYRDCIACNVKGDSMYDRIFPGSRLYVYHLPTTKYIDYGQIYLIILNGYRLLKFIDPVPGDESRVLLRSYNTRYADWSVERADILNLFLVKGYENQSAI